LRWGTPDTNGPSYFNAFSPSRVTFVNPLGYVGKAVSSYTNISSGPTLYSPNTEVKEAWNNGWTGAGKNILLVDGYTGAGTDFRHGVTTMMITDLIAIGSNKYALDYGNSGTSPTGTLLNIDGNAVTTATSMHVVNASFGTVYGSNGKNPSLSADRSFMFTATANSRATWTNVFNGTTSIANLNISDAVITKAAGNDSTDSQYEHHVASFAADSIILPRLLIVGATTGDGTTSSKTTLASYSNKAGSNTTISDRFLVANGKSPYDTGDVGINGYTASAGEGTSYAAPRVAGYAAILRHKFSNLNGEKSASILLDTARYDTLTCHPNCDSTIYGKGEASLSRALAPVGRLR
jgi:hypothetical protein